MKKLLIILLMFFSYSSFSQTDKCLNFYNDITKDVKGKVTKENTVEFPVTYDLESIKAICDTSAKTTKVSFDWRLNGDKNFEKEYIMGNKKVLVTIYMRDKFLYFEFY